MSHLSETISPLETRNINERITECMPLGANVEFIILPYYKTIEEIPNKKDLIRGDFLNSY